MKMAEAFVENTGVTSKEPFSCTVVSRRIMKSALRMTGPVGFRRTRSRNVRAVADLPICPPAHCLSADLPTAYSSFFRTFDPFEAQY